jgi:hypothetical protein
MKRLLLLLDSDPMPNAYDIIVGYDGGADHIVGYGGITLGRRLHHQSKRRRCQAGLT